MLDGLAYSYDALEPHIDAETMRLHHDKHHQSYIDVLNKAIAPYPELDNMTIEDLLAHLNELPEEIRDAVRNSAGGSNQSIWFGMGISRNGSR
jgi:superoxide dismutase, Fe-Mn family